MSNEIKREIACMIYATRFRGLAAPLRSWFRAMLTNLDDQALQTILHGCAKAARGRGGFTHPPNDRLDPSKGGGAPEPLIDRTARRLEEAYANSDGDVLGFFERVISRSLASKALTTLTDNASLIPKYSQSRERP